MANDAAVPTKNRVTITDHATGQQFDLPVSEGTVGPRAIDVRKLYSDHGLFTYDPGFTSTAACESRITYIDGEKGILEHRGYPIEELAEKSNFLEVCYLLLYGELPNASQKATFTKNITYHTMLHEQIHTFTRGFRRDAHPMAVMVGVVGALSAFYHDSTNIDDPREREIASHRLIAKMPTIAAMAFKYSTGQPFIYPRNDLSYAENFLRMTFAVPAEEYVVNPIVAKAMDRFFILHADHEQNCSANTIRSVGSSHVDPYSATAAAIAALYGPLHGGANEEVLRMLMEIGSVQNVPAFIKRVKAGETKLMGFGHRVYKNYDPRARIIKHIAYQVFDLMGKNPLLEIALECERIALEDDYFIKRKLYPNVDFYTGLIYQSMGFPMTMFPALFAIPRTSGWIAQWEEMLLDPEQKIARPRQIYLGHATRHYVPIEERG